MIKLFTLFNVAGLLLFNLLFGSDVSVVHDMPARMEPGTEMRVVVTVNKAQVNGFAKLQIDLPEGFTAAAIETRGASFTFADGKAKFIWMALPTQPSFKVSYTLSASAGLSGSFPITARLSYIEDNERKTVDMVPATLIVGDGAAVAASPAPAVQEAIAQALEESSADLASADGTPIPDAPVTSTAGLPSRTGPGNVSATRTVTPINGSEVLVEVTVNKGLIRGFGKLQENLPEGFTAVAKENDDAIFSVKGRMAKYVWLNLPSKQEMKVSYRLIAPAGVTGTFTINGEFGYLVNDLTQRAVVGSTSFTLDGAAIAATTPEAKEEPSTATAEPAEQVAEVPQPAVTAPVVAAEPAQPRQDVREPEPATAQATPARATHTPAPETGISFKVQITAAHREVGSAYFIQRHRYEGPFSIEHHDGWIKYVTGMFAQYRAARDQRQAYIDAKHDFPGPFVTAYNNGERITVQEALMIARQQTAQ